MRTNLLETRDFKQLVSDFTNKPTQSAFFCNVHMLMLSQEDKALAEAMDTADWVFADGVPISWLQRQISGKNAKVIRGYELLLAVCDYAAIKREKVGFIGSSDEVMKGLVSNLCDQFEGLSVAYQYCPPFMEGELTSSPEELKSITDSQVQWLFVGLGCPKQEKWIATYKDELNCNILGVGAAFDWLSGLEKMPPKWMESAGLGWLHRLLNHPLNLWRRYLIYNSKFLIKVIKTKAGKGWFYHTS